MGQEGFQVAQIVAVAAACFAGWNARNSARSAEQARRTAHANLLVALLRDYADKDMGAAVERLEGWSRNFEAAAQGNTEHFAAEWGRRVGSNDLTIKDEKPMRRRVSHFFTAVRTLCESGLLEEALVARAWGETPFRFFLRVVEPIDREHAKAKGMTHNQANRRFFEGFVGRQFPPV